MNVMSIGLIHRSFRLVDWYESKPDDDVMTWNWHSLLFFRYVFGFGLLVCNCMRIETLLEHSDLLDERRDAREACKRLNSARALLTPDLFSADHYQVAESSDAITFLTCTSPS